MQKIRISASILGADFTRLGDEIRAAEAAGCDEIHFDVMDGRFVPNISIGVPVLEAIRPVTRLPIDVHMMVEEPGRFIEPFAKAGGTLFTVHIEACSDIARTVRDAKQAGMGAGVSIKPATPVAAIYAVIGDVDRVLVMSVEPGFGGQPFLQSSLQKVTELRKLVVDRGLQCQVAIDGGIKVETAGAAAHAGADTLISGTGIFRHKGGVAAGVQALLAAAR